jgi:acetyl-CoA acetyltransferase
MERLTNTTTFTSSPTTAYSSSWKNADMESCERDPLTLGYHVNSEKVNVNGGAMAVGHPLGATGCKLTTALLHELERRGSRYGLIAICEGGGTANATLIERIDSSKL